MASDLITCPSCGARVSPDRDRCELCGTPVSDSTDDRTETEATPGTQPAEQPAEDGGAADSADESSHTEASSEDASTPEAPDSESASEGVYCNQCGWKNPAGANFCSQCGTELQKVVGSGREAASGTPDGTRRVGADLPTGEASVDDASSSASGKETSPSEGEDEQQIMGQQLTMVVGVAVLVVIGLFFVTLWSQSQSWGGGDSTEGADATPTQAQNSRGATNQESRPSSGAMTSGPSAGSGIQNQDLKDLAEETSGPASVAQKVDSLRAQLDEVDGVRERRTKAQLVNLYIGAGQNGQAAVLQREIAQAAGDSDEWKRAANLLYKWMQQLSSEQNRQQAFQVAGQAALAYEKVVAEEPENLDARTRMGETYLLTNNPMKGIQAINGVLEDDSTFVPARFQKGLALLQINRLDQAIGEFEKVKQHADEGSGFYQQADRAIRIIRERSGPASRGASGAGEAPMPEAGS